MELDDYYKGGWRIHRVRTEKLEPNATSTYEKVI